MPGQSGETVVCMQRLDLPRAAAHAPLLRCLALLEGEVALQALHDE